VKAIIVADGDLSTGDLHGLGSLTKQRLNRGMISETLFDELGDERPGVPDSLGKRCQIEQEHDIHNVASHEFGHWVYLGDIDEPNFDYATMYHQITEWGETQKRSLSWYDDWGAEVMYGYR
jgi:hypothetical protein